MSNSMCPYSSSSLLGRPDVCRYACNCSDGSLRSEHFTRARDVGGDWQGLEPCEWHLWSAEREAGHQSCLLRPCLVLAEPAIRLRLGGVGGNCDQVGTPGGGGGVWPLSEAKLYMRGSSMPRNNVKEVTGRHEHDTVHSANQS